MVTHSVSYSYSSYASQQTSQASCCTPNTQTETSSYAAIYASMEAIQNSDSTSESEEAYCPRCVKDDNYNVSGELLRQREMQTLANEYGVSVSELESMLNTDIVTSGTTQTDSVSELFNPLLTSDETGTDNLITFLDTYTQSSVSVPLSDATVAKLTEQFGSLEESAEYVQQWYNYAAYEVGYLKSDQDSDGQISFDEAMDLKLMLEVDGQLNFQGMSSLNETMSDATEREQFLSEFGYMATMEEFINAQILNDTDSSGSLSFQEITGNNALKGIDMLLSGEADDAFSFNRALLQEAIGQTSQYFVATMAEQIELFRMPRADQSGSNLESLLEFI